MAILDAGVIASSVVAQKSVSTRISSLETSAGANSVTISGTTEWRDPDSGVFSFLPGVKVTLSWWQTSASSLTYMGEVYSDDSSGQFSYTWIGSLEPGLYYINAAYAGGDEFQEAINGTTPTLCDFQATSTNAQLAVPLDLAMRVDNPTLSIGQGDSATITIKVTALNSKNAHQVSLSLYSPGQLFSTETFSPQSGSTPFTSKLSLNVLNVTQPGTYTIEVTATAQDSTLSSPPVTTPIQILVQQNTHPLAVTIVGLPVNVQTPLLVDNNFIENVTQGTVSLTISNNASVVSVSKEIVTGDIRYTCAVYSQSASGQSVVFDYATEYKFTAKADLPQRMVSTLLLTVNGSDYTQSNIRPEQGFSDFFPENSVIDFGFNSSEITTSDSVNYKFTDWKDLSTGDLFTPANATSSGLYEITLTRPYYLEAYYDKWVVVSIRTNLPADMSTKLTFGMVGSANQTVEVPGSAKYQAGEYLVGSTFELSVPQDQLVVYNSAQDTRYEFQGMSPLTPLTLTQHTTIQLNYSAEYRVIVASQFPSVIIQPDGGAGWYAPGAMATIQIQGSASSQYGVPYVFDGWGGAITSNETQLSFPVTGPMEIYAQWTPNWSYLLIMVGLAIGLTVPVGLIAKRKLSKAVRTWRSSRKKVTKKQATGKVRKTGEGDMKLYNYIIDKGGSISMKEAIQDLDMSREEITASIQRLKESNMLG